MKSKQRGDAELVGILFVIGIILTGTYFVAKAGCYNKWGDLGFEVDHAFMKGCRVEVQPKVWVPVDSIRDIDLLRKKDESK